jgi:PadR family transcriptional regulator PadR
MVTNDRELLKGNIQTLILAVLEDSSLHGYAIAREIERRSDQGLSFKDGSIYPALRSLEKEGLVVSEWENPASGPARKVYKLLPSGTKQLEARKRTWRELVTNVELVLGGTPNAKPV